MGQAMDGKGCGAPCLAMSACALREVGVTRNKTSWPELR
jgi:hypothetical protein